MATPRTRPVRPDDVSQLVELASRAWAPVFASLRTTLGEELFGRLRPDWVHDQSEAVRTLCEQRDGMTVRVAESADGDIAGFIAFIPDHGTRVGVIEMLGVDPEHQGAGIGSHLGALAFEELTALGMRVAMVETGGDPGHVGARRTYEKAGCTLLPIARYFTGLDAR